ncbi:MAG: universal stress protein [Myxococcota bacterium]
MGLFPPKSLLVATDFSAASRAALEAARFFGVQHQAHITLVHVFDPSPYKAPTLLPGPAKLLDEAANEVIQQTETKLQELCSELLGECTATPVVLRHASPGEAIAEHAESASSDLIIVGSHGRTGLRRILLGSVAERVVRMSTCPVMVIPPAE